jgi:molybdopterin converting factor small subunit
MKCEVKYFGMIGEKLNLANELIDTFVDIVDPLDLKKSFLIRFPQLEKMTFIIAVNGKITNELGGKEVLTIALLPPFAGG